MAQVCVAAHVIDFSSSHFVAQMLGQLDMWTSRPSVTHAKEDSLCVTFEYLVYRSSFWCEDFCTTYELKLLSKQK